MLSILEIEKLSPFARNRYLAAYHELSRFRDPILDYDDMIELGDRILRERRTGWRLTEERARAPHGAARIVMIGRRVKARLQSGKKLSSASA